MLIWWRWWCLRWCFGFGVGWAFGSFAAEFDGAAGGPELGGSEPGDGVCCTDDDPQLT